MAANLTRLIERGTTGIRETPLVSRGQEVWIHKRIPRGTSQIGTPLRVLPLKKQYLRKTYQKPGLTHFCGLGHPRFGVQK